MPVGPLMVEHRLIERMISLLDEESREMSKGQPMRIPFLGDALDFLRFYADRCHHGKEEGILFRDLAGRKLSAEHAEMMKGLVQDHVKARELTAALAQHVRNGPGSCSAAVGTIQALVKLYTGHIRKEDKEFFLPVMEYFTAKEQECMLDKFREFDRLLIHERYKKRVRLYEDERKDTRGHDS